MSAPGGKTRSTSVRTGPGSAGGTIDPPPSRNERRAHPAWTGELSRRCHASVPQAGASVGPSMVPSRAMDGRLVGGRYRLLEAHAMGGMASVWRAVDETSGEKVAVKRLHPHLLDD